MRMSWKKDDGSDFQLLKIYASTFSTNFKDASGNLAKCKVSDFTFLECYNLA